MTKNLFVIFSCIVLMLGCSSVPKESYSIEKQVLHTKKSKQGDELFAFIVTVAATPMMKVNSQKPMTRRELKRFAEHERVEDSPALKLALEEEAVTLLEAELETQQYCQKGYEVHQVFWQNRSVQLRGACS
ncbi:hypothetical protein [Pseudoalteromonas sp. MMG012]|uniref:hypothetical protein n=1 Tax=Pseudoalteromonas sp. MMG012 TaxID=2822686 RepID=UPI001FFD9BEB|nr:hypothetical protein [Pseudoalteromonas sp. MMG012]